MKMIVNSNAFGWFHRQWDDKLAHEAGKEMSEEKLSANRLILVLSISKNYIDLCDV